MLICVVPLFPWGTEDPERPWTHRRLANELADSKMRLLCFHEKDEIKKKKKTEA
ncbi:MAG: hypothetical protein LBS59_06980 [Puniceicoccales bacterium]|jgi:hypothetical protein|nr:hypothetical protein [Puniceicoccales bacterium]